MKIEFFVILSLWDLFDSENHDLSWDSSLLLLRGRHGIKTNASVEKIGETKLWLCSGVVHMNECIKNGVVDF